MHTLQGVTNVISALMTFIGATAVFVAIIAAVVLLKDMKDANPDDHPLAKREKERNRNGN